MIRSVFRHLPLLFLLTAPLITPAGATRLDPAGLPNEWRELFDRLRARTPLRAGFTEVRHLPFRNKAVELEGTLRLAPGVGVSLHYLGKDGSMTTVIDSEGLAIRRDLGPWHPLPDRPEIRAMHRAIGALLTLDLDSLDHSFFLNGEKNGENWTLTLEPKREGKAGRLKNLTVHGDSGRITRIEANMGRNHGITITIHDQEPGVTLQPQEYARYFR